MEVKNLMAGKKFSFGNWQRPFLSLLVMTVGITAVTLLLYNLLPPSQPVYAQAQIDPALQEAIADSEPDELIRFIVHLRQTAAINRLSLPTDELARRTLIVETLRETAVTSQASLLPELESLKADGRLSSYRPLWIINAIAAAGTTTAIENLANRPEIDHISLDASFPLIQPPEITDDISLFEFKITAAPTNTRSWGIDRIRAPHVWHGLGINGSNVTVAIMDSGVDWLHPDLLPNYRGNLGNGSYQHEGNWYHAALPTVTIPIDLLGHGTHVAGTAVGQNGIGVAPGAKWIGVSIFDLNGLIYLSAVHAGFEWLLAPDNDPSLAPDIVNGSWGGATNADDLLDDIATLRAAGIIPIFSTGNDGPYPRTISAPSAYTDTLSVGASDPRDEVAWFSSRGPSFFTAEIQPHIIAPGTTIRSAFPGNNYAIAHGTSMAAPHTTGAAALVLSANPSLSYENVKDALLATAVPVTATHPNIHSGWGRLDVYAAVNQVLPSGKIHGTVNANGLPLPHTAITITTPGGVQLTYVTNDNGQYEAQLQPGTYSILIDIFGFQPQTITGLTLQNTNQSILRNINLVALPSGTVTGIVSAATTGDPLTATVSVIGTNVTVATDDNGRYTLTLPQNQYKLLVRANGRQLGRATILPIVDQTIVRNFNLLPGRDILLVDSGQWYYDSHIKYFENSLLALNLNYAKWDIWDPYTDAPDHDTVAQFDTMIWSDPFYSPLAVEADTVITQFLKTGGNFLISGQHIGIIDGTGFGTPLYWHRDLEGRFINWGPVTSPLTGATGTVFEGLTINLNGGDSANNQETSDYTLPRHNALTDPIFYHSNGLGGGLQTSQCKPFRIIYFGFGLEGVDNGADRAALLDRAFTYFDTPPVAAELSWQPADIDDYALLGQQLIYTTTIRNLSETTTDTISLQIAGNNWATTITTSTLTLGPCETGQTVMTISVPDNLPANAVHTMQLVAHSSINSNITAALNIRHKIPGHILFIDDDRWYNNEDILLASLDEMNILYDVWQTGWEFNTGRGSPTIDYLEYYDFVIWYTGSDWFRPITNEENTALYQYLKQGGRLFLTSQDYLYYHWHQPLAQKYLGLLDYQESITPTRLFAGNSQLLLDDLAGPIPLSYLPYPNYSDGLLPASNSQAMVWGNEGYPVGIATGGQTNAGEDWRVVFWSIPFETMTTTAHTPAMNSIMGWLSDLGESSFTVDRRTAAAGATQRYTITIQTIDSGELNHVWLTNTLPVSLTIALSSIQGGATYDPVAHQLHWDGRLNGGEMHVISYEATAVAPPGTRLDNRLWLNDTVNKIRFEKTAVSWVTAPDLSQSQLTAAFNPVAPLRIVTYTLQLRNTGLTTTNGISAVVRLPDELNPVPSTLQFGSGVGQLITDRIVWEGDLLPNEAVTVSLVLTHTTTPEWIWLSATAVINDGVTDTQLIHHLERLRPYVFYMPLIAKK